MRMELRIRTTGWSRELVEHAKNALRELDWNDDHHVYEVVTDDAGDSINLEDLETLYDGTLGETAEQLGIAARGYRLMAFDELETEQLMDLWTILQHNEDLSEPPPSDLAGRFILDFAAYLEKFRP